MSLVLFAANALVGSYLNGRQLPDALLSTVVRAVEVRLIDGKTPVLDESLRKLIDSELDDPTPVASQSQGHLPDPQRKDATQSPPG
ncbi:hypothetical protein QTI66_15890 [Variovorax sp. J22R133]|uniref:hypothetical protein n=1 Tax=Variovorax brevis TaxID=3053503 RepID=UPI00257671EA|nr:hypothetical protein [Variovorax sp. J22R133]MDM0113640.1 hypothetical protein [Variovorax sp. J22R133]